MSGICATLRVCWSRKVLSELSSRFASTVFRIIIWITTIQVIDQYLAWVILFPFRQLNTISLPHPSSGRSNSSHRQSQHSADGRSVSSATHPWKRYTFPTRIAAAHWPRANRSGAVAWRTEHDRRIGLSLCFRFAARKWISVVDRM